MDSAGKPQGDHTGKELTVSLAASSMINASDMISAEAYQANLQRIQEVKEMVRRLEMNNEVAHKNFLVDQLEKRAQDGREAEDMLARLRSQPGISETVQFARNVSSSKPEVILPTTATLVEVPESRSSLSYSTPVPPTTSGLSQAVQQRLANNHRILPTQVRPYYSDPRYYAPPNAIPQHVAVHLSQPPVDAARNNQYSTQNMPLQFSTHNSPTYQTSFQPRNTQQPSQSRSSYPPPVAVLPTVPPASSSGYYPSPAGWITTGPTQSGPITGSNLVYREPALPTPSSTYNQQQNLPSHAPISQAQIPLQSVSIAVPSGQPPSARSYPRPSEPLSHQPQQQLQQPHRFPAPLQPQPQSLQFQRSPHPPLQPQQQPQQPQTQPQQIRQLVHQSQRHPERSQALPPSQQSLHPLSSHPQGSLLSADRIQSTVASQFSQPTNVQEQVQQRGPQPHMDQATFVKLFQVAAQHDTSKFKTFLVQAKAAGIIDEWFVAGFHTLPRDQRESVMAWVSQPGSSVNAPLPTNGPTPQPQESSISGSIVPLDIARPSSTMTSHVQMSGTQQTTKPNTSMEGTSAYPLPVQASAEYAAHLQYYAGQAKKWAISAQEGGSSMPSGNVVSAQTMPATPTREVPHAPTNERTPKDAKKSTLARDILRSLGKTVAEPQLGVADELASGADNLALMQPSRVTSPELRAITPPTSSVAANPSILSAGPTLVTSPDSSTAIKEENRAVTIIDGPIMIDLTAEDSDESVDGKESNLPIQKSTGTAAPLQLASANTTNDTPLLESLSLEESPVDATTHSLDADVRMHTPPLSSAVEEDMETELLYPPHAIPEFVSPSFELPPEETSEHLLDGKLPLFLPSPPMSPTDSQPFETNPATTVDEAENGPPPERRSVDVEETRINTSVTPPLVKKRRKQQVYVLIPPAPLYVKKARLRKQGWTEGTDSDLDGVGEDEEFQYSGLEQLLIEESKSRLIERRCRWSDCGSVLNCAANLLAHLKNHAREEDLQAPFVCRWVDCQRQFGVGQERDVHLERHTIRPLPCPFAGCDEQFEKPVEVMQHEVQHQRADHGEPLMPKPICQPTVPAIPARLGPPPHRLPSHRVIPRRVLKCRISADRHAIVGPWVLWNIWSPVDLKTRKQNVSMRARPTRQATDYNNMDGTDPRRDDYDFLLGLSSPPVKNAGLDDLDSTLVTMSAARGLTLWGTGNGTRGEEDAVERMLSV